MKKQFTDNSLQLTDKAMNSCVLFTVYCQLSTFAGGKDA